MGWKRVHSLIRALPWADLPCLAPTSCARGAYGASTPTHDRPWFHGRPWHNRSQSGLRTPVVLLAQRIFSSEPGEEGRRGPPSSVRRTRDARGRPARPSGFRASRRNGATGQLPLRRSAPMAEHHEQQRPRPHEAPTAQAAGRSMAGPGGLDARPRDARCPADAAGPSPRAPGTGLRLACQLGPRWHAGASWVARLHARAPAEHPGATACGCDRPRASLSLRWCFAKPCQERTA